MRLSATLPWLALLPSIGSAFKFTKPDPNKKLDLSAEVITIAWTTETNDAAAYDRIDIWWNGPPGFGYELVKNFPLAAGTGEFGWNPKGVRQSLELSNMTLPSAKEYEFKAQLHLGNSTRGAGILSDKYAVEGYSRISAGHRLLQGSAGWLLVLGACMLSL